MIKYLLINPDTGRVICGGKEFDTPEEASHYGHRHTVTNWDVTTNLAIASRKKRKKGRKHE